jgi:hypothetical protein
MKNEPPSDFDWVLAREQCSAGVMFEKLYQMAKANVAQRNATILRDDPTSRERFKFIDHSSHGSRRLFTVLDDWHRKRRAVDFSLDGDEITVNPHDAPDYRARLTLTDEGVCKFKVDDDELAPWQLLRRALEPLLFD